jgi:NAD-dependent dihydropyrimidine dehydrogenase PreA subunit
MSARRLEKSEVPKLLAAARGKGYSIWAPVTVGDAVEFRPLENGAMPSLEYANARLSPKAMVFPQSERMFVFGTDRTREDAFVLKEPPGEEPAQMALGIRPCDARALLVLDKVFLTQGAVQDPFYARRREIMLLVGLGCNGPCSTCFCHWTGGGPFSSEGLDVLLTDLGSAYLLQTTSPKGEAFLEGVDLKPASAEEVGKAEQFARDALAAMGVPKDPRPIQKRALLEVFAEPYWEKAQETCIKCGTCTYLCPTCSCFDIQDEVHGACGMRGRNWDTCMSGLTTLHASGHNPRPTGKERFRQRFMHKLKYFLDDFDTIMCVGCGRCVQQCPVNIDIREIIETLSA